MRDFHGHELSEGVPPPAWAERFRSDDLDEVREAVARTDGEHSRVAHGTGPLGYELAWLHGEIVSMAWARVALPTTLRGELPNVVMHVMPPGSWYRFGRREYEIGRSDALFVVDRWEFTRHSPPGAGFAIDLDKGALIEEIAARSAGRPGRLMLTTQRLAIDDAAHARLHSAVSSLVQARVPSVSVQAAQRLEADLLSVVAELLIGQSAVIHTRHATRVRIADLEGWIEANLERPITAGQLCRIAGVSQRGLEKIFESRRGMSPMRFVAERRLAAAERMLGSASPGDDVTRVALGHGFNHAGRFSALYRQTYGELPSQTLKRALRRRG
jgi:AraC-like DNA-binding protein